MFGLFGKKKPEKETTVTEARLEAEDKGFVEGGGTDRYRLLFETSSDAMMVLSEQKFLDCNPAALKMFGLDKKEEFLDKHPADLSPPIQANGKDSASEENARIKETLEGGVNKFEWIHRRANGEDFPVLVWLTAFTLDGKRVIQASVRELTEQKEAEKARETSNRIMKGVSVSAERFLGKDISDWEENVLLVLSELGNARQAGRVYACKNQVREGKQLVQLRYEWKRELGGKTFEPDDEKLVDYSVVGWGDWAGKLSRREAVMVAGEQADGFARVWNVDERTKYLMLLPVFVGDFWWGEIGVEDWESGTECSEPEREAMQTVALTFGAAVDFKRTQEKLGAFRFGIERSSDVVFMTDEEGVIQYANPAFEKTYGYSQNDWQGKTPRILKGGLKTKEFYEGYWKTLKNKKVMSVEFHNKNKSGDVLVMESSVNPVTDAKGRLEGFLAIQRDITKQELLNEDIRRNAEKNKKLNDSLVGRELKMIELKRELKRLKGSDMGGYAKDELAQRGKGDAETA